MNEKYKTYEWTPLVVVFSPTRTTECEREGRQDSNRKGDWHVGISFRSKIATSDWRVTWAQGDDGTILITATLTRFSISINSLWSSPVHTFHPRIPTNSSKSYSSRFVDHFYSALSSHFYSTRTMLLIFAVVLSSFCLQSVVIRAQANHFQYGDEQPEKFIVTHEAWFNISIREDKLSPVISKSERIVIGLFGEICPMTVTNFITITKGLRRGSVCTTRGCLSHALLSLSRLFSSGTATRVCPFIVSCVISSFKPVISLVETVLEVGYASARCQQALFDRSSLRS